MSTKQTWNPYRDEDAPPFEIEGYDAAVLSRRAECLLEVNGQNFLFRRGSGLLDESGWSVLIFFRNQAQNSTEWTFFLEGTYSQDASWQEESLLVERIQKGRYGRIIPVPITTSVDCNAYELVYFLPDGTGFIQPWSNEGHFTWTLNASAPSDILTAGYHHLQTLARACFDEANARLSNPYIDPEALENQPLEFLSGSQEALEQVTRWICHAELEEPKDLDYWEVTYYADSKILLVANDNDFENWEDGGQLPHLPILCTLFELAYEHNPFTGHTWEYNDDAYRVKNSYDLCPISIEFQFAKPGQEERRQAREELGRWLQGKLPAEEIKNLFSSEA